MTRSGRRSWLAQASAGLALSSSGCGRSAILELMSVGPRAERRVPIGRGALDLEVGLRGLRLPLETVERWALRAAEMIHQYTGRFIEHALPIRVLTGGFGGIAFGQHTQQSRVLILVGADSTPEALRRDPILVHELLHATFPRLARRHSWMREGLSTYLETLLRCKAGVLSEASLWRIWARSMPRGVPARGARGLDRTRGWASTYWGGALFWFLADVALHERGHSLSAVLRAVLDAGGDSRQRWPVSRVIDVGDQAVGGTVLRGHYERMARRAHRPDVPALLSRLGVHVSGRDVELNDLAPLAPVRHTMTAQSIRLPALAVS